MYDNKIRHFTIPHRKLLYGYIFKWRLISHTHVEHNRYCSRICWKPKVYCRCYTYASTYIILIFDCAIWHIPANNWPNRPMKEHVFQLLLGHLDFHFKLSNVLFKIRQYLNFGTLMFIHLVSFEQCHRLSPNVMFHCHISYWYPAICVASPIKTKTKTKLQQNLIERILPH